MARFTADELSQLQELLKIARASLHETLMSVHSRYPQAAMCESLRTWIGQSADFEERLAGVGQRSIMVDERRIA